MPTVRAEQPSDFEAVRNVNERAFRRTDEAALVDVLRDDTLLIASLVAIEGRVVGHAMFSRVWIDDASGVVPMASLAPMAVLPECQRKGIGAALIARGIEECRAGGWPAIVVVGHTDYYPRFGFSAEAVAHLASPYAGAYFMGLDLRPGALAHMRGRVRYPPVFDRLK
ncbi:MAG TPA: N-acetyltransferase [Vicinamibacterales bacterium]|nr:N-acetyltransferase [Vicinamibacterales bacterium]